MPLSTGAEGGDRPVARLRTNLTTERKRSCDVGCLAEAARRREKPAQGPGHYDASHTSCPEQTAQAGLPGLREGMQTGPFLEAGLLGDGEGG